MPKLIDKLNVLVRSSIQDVLGDDVVPSRRRPPLMSRLGKEIDKEIAALREQIERALDDEEQMQADLAAMQEEAASLDQQANQALLADDEANARYFVRQMKLKQQHAAMQEADIVAHRRSTSELIQRVNELEAVVANARHQQAAAAEDSADEAADSLSARIRQVRQKLRGEPEEPVVRQETPVEDQDVDDDLARRRARLSE